MEQTAETVLITGASTGIGWELARCFARDGHGVIMHARDEERLTAAAGRLQAEFDVPVVTVVADLSVPGGVSLLLAKIDALGLSVSVLVNNAGFGVFGWFAASERETLLQLLQVNVMALTELTHRLLPGMTARGYGRVVNIASTAAFQPGPLMAVYYASKAYVLSFSEAIRNELQTEGIIVTAVCPGPTITSFQIRAQMENNRVFTGYSMTAADVARASYEGMRRNQAIIVPGARNRVFASLVRFVPRSLLPGLIRRVQGRDVQRKE